jgi:hypothetical protein
MSGGGPDCVDLSFGGLFAACNEACFNEVNGIPGDPTAPSVGECIFDVDCLNNGGEVMELTDPSGEMICATGTCDSGEPCNDEFPCAVGECVPLEINCHEQPLCQPEDGLIPNQLNGPLCFEPPGPAGSDSECNQARGNDCTLLDCPVP